MSCPFNDEQLMQLQVFIELCKTQPQILHHPRLSFFKDYLVSLGVTLPTATFGTKHFTPAGDGGQTEAGEKVQSSSEEESEPESDVELNMEGVVEGDSLGDDQLMGDVNKEPSDEERDLSGEKRSEAMRAFSEQQFEEAIKLYTEAIQLNPQSALLFAKRGQVYLKLNKPNACIKDCTRALELNCDSAAAYKFRGRAYSSQNLQIYVKTKQTNVAREEPVAADPREYKRLFRLLGKFEEASHDLCESLKIDYDDQTNEWMNDVKPNAEKLRQHKLSAQRKKEEKEHREKLRRVRKAQEARSKAAKAQAQANAQSAPAGGMPAGMPGMPGGMPGAGSYGLGGNDIGSLLTDPEIITAFQDPEVMAAFQDLSTNPANFVKYQSNPKIASAIQKLQTKLGKDSMPYGAGAGAGFGKGPSDDDVGLD